MKKIIVNSFFVLLQASILFGQKTELDKCGLDNNPKINSFEAKYFNEVFENRKDTFDFSEKVIAFYSGSTGTNKSTKSNYFNPLKNGGSGDIDIHNWQAMGTQLLILTYEEKELSGGYDAILVSWSKLLIVGNSRAKLVKRLKNTLPKTN